MAVMRWDPFRELQSMEREMERFFEEPSRLLPWRWGAAGEGLGALDVYETEDQMVVEVSVPGLKAEDVTISVTDHTLTLKGERKLEREIKREQYLRQERRYGSFTRSVTLPPYAEVEKAEATYEHGILKIAMPKAEQAKAKTIQVKVQPTIEGQKAE
ncbi:MAG: Hsp20/alpha crystallin family protein [Chloroflexi bacterium]|nr:Hsp20/alpha crystallin family protein [Chloroflexota bacterium]